MQNCTRPLLTLLRFPIYGEVSEHSQNSYTRKTSQTSNSVQCHWMYAANGTAFGFLPRKKVSRWHIFFFFFSFVLLFFFFFVSLFCHLSSVISRVARLRKKLKYTVHILSAFVGWKKCMEKGAKWPTRQVPRWFVLANIKQKKKNDNENNNSKKLDKANLVGYSVWMVVGLGERRKSFWTELIHLVIIQASNSEAAFAKSAESPDKKKLKRNGNLRRFSRNGQTHLKISISCSIYK